MATVAQHVLEVVALVRRQVVAQHVLEVVAVKQVPKLPPPSQTFDHELDPTKVVFRPSNAPLSARFSGVQVIDPGNGQASFIAPFRSFRIAPDASDRIGNIFKGDERRLDIVSLEVYRRPDLWWLIAEANDILNPFEEPRAGDRIRIPSVTRIFGFLGQVSTGTEKSRTKP